jgi:hypothetical protein
MDRMIPTAQESAEPGVPSAPIDMALEDADRIATALESIAKSLEKFVKAAIDEGELGVTTYPGKFAK